MAILSQVSSVVAVTPTVSSGSNAEFDIYTINVAPGSVATYKIVGVSASEIGIPLQGTFIVGSYASANNPVATRISIPTKAIPGGNSSETLTLAVSLQYTHSASEVLVPPVVTPVFKVLGPSYPPDLGFIATFAIFALTPVPDGTVENYSISGVDASDIANGQLSGTVTMVGNIATLYIQTLAHTKFIGNETITVTVNGVSASTTLIDKAPVAIPTYSLYPNSVTVIEGNTATFTLNTTNVPSGTPISYFLSGIESGDILNGQLSGTVVANSTGQTIISIPTIAHLVNQGNKTLTVNVNGITASESLIDLAPAPAPTYKLTASTSQITEGDTIKFTLNTTNLSAGKTIPYSLSGIIPADIAGGIVSGNLTLDSNGSATISIQTISHTTNQGNKSLSFNVNNVVSSITLIDASPSVIPDTFDGKLLTIPKVSVAGINYSNVVVSLGDVLSVGGGYANAVFDSYDLATNHLNISSVNAFGNLFNNVIVTVGTVLSINGVVIG